MPDLYIIHTGNFLPISDQFKRPLLFLETEDANLFASHFSKVKIKVHRLDTIPLNFKSVHFSLLVRENGGWRGRIVIFKVFDDEDQVEEDAETDFHLNVNSPVLLNTSEVVLSDELVEKNGIGKNFLRRS